MGAFVELTKISKSYGKKNPVVVIREIDLSIEQGEFVILMGPSGSGKTTLLNLIGGLDRPTEGTIVSAGQRIDDMSASRLSHWRAANAGFVFQAYYLMAAITAKQNVELPLLLTSLTSGERNKRVSSALELVGLGARMSHLPRNLSGGEQQRVAIARSIVSDPSLLICDEPTGNLDRRNATEVMELLKILNMDQRKTIIMVTHDPEVASYASRTILLDKGVLADGLNLNERRAVAN